MKKVLLILVAGLFNFMAISQTTPANDCFKKLEDAFAKRGSYTVGDEMHRNVIISFFGEQTQCVTGKARVENGTVVSIFLQFDDSTYELYEKKFYNAKKQNPVITNGISEMIYTVDGEKFRVIFIDKLKPKQKSYKEVELPDDL